MATDVVMITGASAGVGRATALEFAKKGCFLGLIARGQKRLEDTLKQVNHLGAKGMIFSADVTDSRAVDQAAESLEAAFGPITIWINNAMTTVFSEFEDLSVEDFRRVTEVTYLGYVNGTRSALKRMRKNNKGAIVQVGSVLAYRSIPLQSAYCGAKHAIEGFTESIRSELLYRKSSIHISMVQLPAINTPQFSWCKNNMDKKSQPVAPIFQPEVAAKAIYWAAYHRQREVTFGLRSEIILWGNRFFPGLGDRYLAKTGYQSQMRKEREDKNRSFNLYEPAPYDYGAHGDFDLKAIPSSPFLKLLMYRTVIVTIIGAIIVGFLLWP